MKRPTPVPLEDDNEQKRLKEESQKARQAHSVGNLSAEVAARAKRHPEKKESPKADDR